MTLKKKLGMGITSAVLGAALVGGGTFAFFSDKEVSNNTLTTVDGFSIKSINSC